HDVDGVLQLEDFPSHLHRDLLAEVPLSDSGSNVSDVAHLISQVVGHQVNIVGELLPGPGYAFDCGLCPKLAFHTYFAGYACYFRTDNAALLHHTVYDVGIPEKASRQGLIAAVDSDRFGKVTFTYRCDHASHFGGVLGDILHDTIDGVNLSRP